MTMEELRDYNSLCGLLSKHPIRKTIEKIYNPKKKVIAVLPCRNEAKNLPEVLLSMLNQTHPFYEIILVNDASTDDTKEIAKSYGVVVIDLKKEHPSYINNQIELAKIYNHQFPYIYSNNLKYDYLMQHGGDIILPNNYVESLVTRMEYDKRIVIAGGIIKGEFQNKTHVRGAGRFYKANFWNKYIKYYLLNHTWESYPLFKALSLGFTIKNYPDLVMISLRDTRLYKHEYGLSMRELGYFPPFAILKCISSTFFGKKEYIQILLSYIFSPSGIIDVKIKNWIRLHQIRRMLSPMDSLKIWMSRI